MSKILDLDMTVFDIIQKYPEAADIMKDIGFDSITNPAMLKTAGRFMTLKKGAVMKNIDLKNIVQAFEVKDFEIHEKE